MARSPLNPVLERNPHVALGVGRIVLAYGEIELLVTQCLGVAIGQFDIATRVMFAYLGETARVGTADVLMRNTFIHHGLEHEYAKAIGAAKKSIALRNQYAHVHWGGDDGEGGVFFANLRDSVSAVSEPVPFWFLHIDYELLEDQWDYMRYAADCLTYIWAELKFRMELITGHNGVMPEERAPPILNNPPLEHIPPWLGEAEKLQHLEHFQPPEPDQPRPPKPKPPSNRERREAHLWRADLSVARARLLRLLRQKPGL